MLKRTNDRKVTNAANASGKVGIVANSFGLPSGNAFSCPGATSVCAKVCYAGKLEKIYKGVRGVLIHNWELINSVSVIGQVSLLANMIDEFRKDSVKRNAPLVFRIHWDGDFFSESYAMAWANVIKRNPDVQFWVYTRSFTDKLNVVPILGGIPNLALYLSVDDENVRYANVVREEYPGVKLAYLSDTFENAKPVMLELTGKPGAKCPENAGAIPLITKDGGACVSCGLCVFGKADIRFATSKR